jgi:hypothetical protein
VCSKRIRQAPDGRARGWRRAFAPHGFEQWPTVRAHQGVDVLDSNEVSRPSIGSSGQRDREFVVGAEPVGERDACEAVRIARGGLRRTGLRIISPAIAPSRLIGAKFVTVRFQ